MNTETLARLILSGIVVLGFGGVMSVYIIWPPAENTLIAAMIGVLGSGYLLVLNWWFSKSSEGGPKP
jgi:sugar phosphate permease